MIDTFAETNGITSVDGNQEEKKSLISDDMKTEIKGLFAEALKEYAEASKPQITKEDILSEPNTIKRQELIKEHIDLFL